MNFLCISKKKIKNLTNLLLPQIYVCIFIELNRILPTIKSKININEYQWTIPDTNPIKNVIILMSRIHLFITGVLKLTSSEAENLPLSKCFFVLFRYDLSFLRYHRLKRNVIFNVSLSLSRSISCDRTDLPQALHLRAGQW